MKQRPRAKEKIHESLGAGVIWVTSDPAVLPPFTQHPEALTQQQNENREDTWTPLWVGPGTKRSLCTVTADHSTVASTFLVFHKVDCHQVASLAPQHPPALLAPLSLGFLRSQWGLSMFCCWTVLSRFLKSSHDTVVLWGQCWGLLREALPLLRFVFLHLYLDFLAWIIFYSGYYSVLCYPRSLIVYIDQDCISRFLLLDFAHVLFQSLFK